MLLGEKEPQGCRQERRSARVHQARKPAVSQRLRSSGNSPSARDDQSPTVLQDHAPSGLGLRLCALALFGVREAPHDLGDVLAAACESRS